MMEIIVIIANRYREGDADKWSFMMGSPNVTCIVCMMLKKSFISLLSACTYRLL